MSSISKSGIIITDYTPEILTVRQAKQQNKTTEQTCIICLSKFKECDKKLKEQEIIILKCGHVFHTTCLKPWEQQNPYCPSDRKPIYETHVITPYHTFILSSLNFNIISKLFEKTRDKEVLETLSNLFTIEKKKIILKNKTTKRRYEKFWSFSLIICSAI